MTSLHYYLFFCVFFFVFSSRTDRFFNLSCHLFFLSFLLKTNFIFHENHFFGFSQKIMRRGKNHLFLLLSLCRSRQILDYSCSPIKGSQLTPHVQVRLTCSPSNIHVFFFKQISCLQSVVCEYIPLFYVCFEPFVLSSFENVIELECDVRFAICAVFMAVVVYT